MIDDVRRLLLREIRTLIAEINATPDSQLWVTPRGISNSLGNLGLHLAGNLRHFVGAGLGDSGFVRDRAREFEARDLPRETVIFELEAAGREVGAALDALAPERLEAPYPVAGVELPTRRFLLHLCAHAALHVGQAGYLRRILTGENVSVGVTPIPDLVD